MFDCCYSHFISGKIQYHGTEIEEVGTAAREGKPEIVIVFVLDFKLKTVKKISVILCSSRFVLFISFQVNRNIVPRRSERLAVVREQQTIPDLPDIPDDVIRECFLRMPFESQSKLKVV